MGVTAPVFHRLFGRPTGSGRTGPILLQAFFIALTNPKSLFFLAAFFPQFINPAASTPAQLWLLCPSFLVIAGIFDSSYALLAGRARRWLKDRRHVMIGERITGCFLIGAGLWLALARRG